MVRKQALALQPSYAILSELPGYRNGPYADLRKWVEGELEELLHELRRRRAAQRIRQPGRERSELLGGRRRPELEDLLAHGAALDDSAVEIGRRGAEDERRQVRQEGAQTNVC